jgi:gas vesicle protein
VKETSVMTATVLGAIVGGVAGYLFFTERGKAMRRQLEPALEEFARELSGFRSSVERLSVIASEGLNALNQGSDQWTRGGVRH